jgi:hypothetical protein
MACARGCDCDACFALGIGAPAPGTPVGLGGPDGGPLMAGYPSTTLPFP